MSASLSVIVMAYNEAAGLPRVVEDLLRSAAGATDDYEILIVDDGSLDDTGALADQLAAENEHIRVVHHQPNQGLGGVYRTGFAEARKDVVTFFPADGQFPADIASQFHLRMHDHDIVLGYLPERAASVAARFLSFAERVLYLVLFGGLPRFQGILMFRRSLLDEHVLVSTGRGWVVLYEFLLRAKKKGARIVSVPTTVRPRAEGQSKVTNLRSAWANFAEVVRLRFRF